MIDIGQKITPFLWFDRQADEAMQFYVSLFPQSRIVSIARYGGGPMEGSVLTGVFELAGQTFMALDGGPQYKFTEAISLFVNCETQEEVDFLWDKLSEGGEEQMCGWLKDKYGVSWQIIPAELPRMLTDPDPERSRRAMETMLTMRKIDIRRLREA